MKILIFIFLLSALLFGQHSLEECLDVTFDNPSNWAALGGWAANGVSGGVATCDGTGGNLYQQTRKDANVGSEYRVIFTVLNYSSGKVRIQDAGIFNGNPGTFREANGTYTEYITATTTNDRLYIYSSNFDGSVDNASYRLKLATLYISKSGLDSDSGKVDSPVLTLGEAQSRGFYSGGAFNIGAGTYDETFTVDSSTTITGNSCTVTAIACGSNAVTLEGNDFTITTLTGSNITDNRTFSSESKGYGGYGSGYGGY